MGTDVQMGMTPGKSLVDKRGRITLPVEIRESLSIAPGDAVMFELSGATIVIRRVMSKKEMFSKLKGCITERNQVERSAPMSLKRVLHASGQPQRPSRSP